MIDKTELLKDINRLLKFARDRNTYQGVKIYEIALKKINETSDQKEIEDFTKKVIHALSGIEAHGYFTDEEYQIVKKIRALI